MWYPSPSILRLGAPAKRPDLPWFSSELIRSVWHYLGQPVPMFWADGITAQVLLGGLCAEDFIVIVD